MTVDLEAVTRALADETNNIALIICSTSGSAGGPALTTAEHIVAHLASALASLPDDRLAEAWDRGWSAARQVDRATPKSGDNPYRAALSGGDAT